MQLFFLYTITIYNVLIPGNLKCIIFYDIPTQNNTVSYKIFNFLIPQKSTHTHTRMLYFYIYTQNIILYNSYLICLSFNGVYNFIYIYYNIRTLPLIKKQPWQSIFVLYRWIIGSLCPASHLGHIRAN